MTGLSVEWEFQDTNGELLRLDDTPGYLYTSENQYLVAAADTVKKAMIIFKP